MYTSVPLLTRNGTVSSMGGFRAMSRTYSAHRKRNIKIVTPHLKGKEKKKSLCHGAFSQHAGRSLRGYIYGLAPEIRHSAGTSKAGPEANPGDAAGCRVRYRIRAL